MACSPQQQWDELDGWGQWDGGPGVSDIRGELSTGPQLRQLWVPAREVGHVWVSGEWTPRSSLRLHHVTRVTKALQSTQETCLYVTNQPD